VRPLPSTPPFPYTTLFRSERQQQVAAVLRDNPNVESFTSNAGSGGGGGGGGATGGNTGRVFVRLKSRQQRKLTPEQVIEELRPRSEEHTSELQSLAYLVCR